MLVELTRIEAAARNLRQWLAPTPLIRSWHLSRKLHTNVWLKLETVQPTHSFKVRGAYHAISSLPSEVRAAGVVTASGGNHGLALAHAADTLGLTATVLLPENSSSSRVDAIRSLGARVVLHGSSWDEANSEAQSIAERSGASYIHPFDNVDVMAGQGSIVTELVQQISRIDVLVASIGGGGLISGLISAAVALTPQTKVIGVETEGADSMYQSWRAGKIVELPAITSIAETLGARRTAQRPFDIVTQYASQLVTVSDEQAIAALLEVLEAEKLLTEPATSCSVAALLAGKIPCRTDDHVVIVLCGANIGLERLAGWIRGPS